MKTLYLLRHAKSSWKFPELADFDRPLNPRGKRDAPKMGQRLRKRGVLPTLLMSSPALRAKKTAQKVARELGYPVSSIQYNPAQYEASLGELLTILRNVPDQVEALMLAGHNPELTALANYITPHYIDNIVTAGVVAIDLPVARWDEIAKKHAGQFLWYDYPKLKS